MSKEARNALHQILANCAFAIGIIATEVLLWNHREALGASLWWLQLPIGISCLAVSFLGRNQHGSKERSVQLRPGSMVENGAEDTESVREQLTELAQRIEKREQDLNERLKTFHEWMEFPQPLNIADDNPMADSPNDVANQDQQLFKLIEDESKRVFDKILNGAYSQDGVVQIEEIRDEATDLVRRIARIYQPGSQDPLLETSVAQILHASSRASLQFITVLEELPLDVKDYSIQSIYDYVEKGVKAYGVYKKFEPYKPYVDTAYYLGRFAMGASPITLGAWWLVGTIGQKGAQALTNHVLEGQALTFLHNLIRVIGYEVAGIYSGNFRHRDPNWFYAVELVELIHTFPASRKSLDRGLNEIGRLSLRSEYDRIYLYRCLAAHQSAKPDQFDSSVLSVAERSQIASRLEQLFHEDIHGATTERTDEWKTALEQRLNVQMKLDSALASKRSEQESLALAARSLASFVVDVKSREAGEIAGLLESTQTLRQMDPSARAQWLLTTEKNPPFYFEPPDLDPIADTTATYLADLAALAVETAPYGKRTRALFIEVGHFLRQEEKEVADNFDRILIASVGRNLAKSQPEGELTPTVADLAATHLPSDSKIRFVYSNLSLDPPPTGSESTFLFATDNDLKLMQSDGTEIWRSDDSTRASQQTLLGQGHCQITGGQWLDKTQRAIKVDLPILSGYAAHFQPLLDRLPAS